MRTPLVDQPLLDEDLGERLLGSLGLGHGRVDAAPPSGGRRLVTMALSRLSNFAI